MTTFFNQKEEVINIQLTPYGKQQFAQGKFSPEYYAFFDTNILYDGQHANISETQNNIKTRIQEETPRLKPLTRFTSSLGSVISVESADLPNQIFQANEANANYNRFLGTSSPWSDFNPSWDISVMPGSSTEFNDGVTYQFNNTIPLMSASSETVYHRSGSAETPLQNLPIVDYTSESLSLDVQELNTIFKLNGNFDIEVFEQRPDQTLRRLYFIDQEIEGADNLMRQISPRQLAITLEGSENEISSAFPVLDDTFVEFYLNIFVDTEIPGVTMPSISTLYRGEQEPSTNICDENTDIFR